MSQQIRALQRELKEKEEQCERLAQEHIAAAQN